MENLESDANNIDWSTLYTSDNTDEQVDYFNKTLNVLFEKHVPIKSISLKTKPQPSIDSNILNLIKLRDSMYSIWKTNKHSTAVLFLFHRYNILRNQTKYAIKNSKKTHFAEQFSDEDNCGNKWKIFNNLGLTKSSDKAKLDPDLFTTDEINSHFTNLETIKPTNDFIEYVNPNMPIFSIKPIHSIDILHAINKIKSNAIGNDGVSIKFLKLIIEYVIDPLTFIVNNSFGSNCFSELSIFLCIRLSPYIEKLLNVKSEYLEVFRMCV